MLNIFARNKFSISIDIDNNTESTTVLWNIGNSILFFEYGISCITVNFKAKIKEIIIV